MTESEPFNCSKKENEASIAIKGAGDDTQQVTITFNTKCWNAAGSEKLINLLIELHSQRFKRNPNKLADKRGKPIEETLGEDFGEFLLLAVELFCDKYLIDTQTVYENPNSSIQELIKLKFPSQTSSNEKFEEGPDVPYPP